MTSCLRDYWPEYLIEAAGLRAFMISAFVFTVLLMHPGSPVTLWIADPACEAGSDRNRHELTGHWLIYSLGHTVVSVSGMSTAFRPSVRICVAS